MHLGSRPSSSLDRSAVQVVVLLWGIVAAARCLRLSRRRRACAAVQGDRWLEKWVDASQGCRNGVCGATAAVGQPCAPSAEKAERRRRKPSRAPRPSTTREPPVRHASEPVPARRIRPRSEIYSVSQLAFTSSSSLFFRVDSRASANGPVDRRAPSAGGYSGEEPGALPGGCPLTPRHR